MNLWVQSGLPQGPQKAQDLLDRLQTLYSQQQQGWEDLQPNSVVYTTVIHGWAKVGNASKASHVLQQQLQDYKHGNVKAQPDTQTFNAVLEAWAKSRVVDSHDEKKNKAPHQQAEQVVAQMRAYQCPPDSYSFTNLLTCWANSKHPRAAEKTEGILRDMLELVKSGETRVRLNIVAYNTGKCDVV
jgi:pentatricopeptide repeat protein